MRDDRFTEQGSKRGIGAHDQVVERGITTHSYILMLSARACNISEDKKRLND